MSYEEELKAVPSELAEIAKKKTADKQFAATCLLVSEYQAWEKAPLMIVSDLRAIADFVERIY